MERAYYSIIPATVMNDSNLSANEKLLYAEITALANEKGYCFMSNKAFAERLNTSDRSIRRWLQSLSEKGYLVIKVIRNENQEVLERRIYINDAPSKEEEPEEPLRTDLSIPLDKNDHTSGQIWPQSITEEYYIKKENTTYSRKKEQFTPPTVEEISEYCRERNNNVDAQKVYDFYSANNWKDSNGKKLKNWKQKIIGVWEKDKAKKKVPDFDSYVEVPHPTVSINVEDLPF